MYSYVHGYAQNEIKRNFQYCSLLSPAWDWPRQSTLGLCSHVGCGPSGKNLWKHSIYCLRYWISEYVYHLVSSQNCEKWLLVLSYESVWLSVCVEQLNSYWMDFLEIWCLSIFWKSIEKIQVSLKSDKNNGYITRRPMYIFDPISLSSH